MHRNDRRIHLTKGLIMSKNKVLKIKLSDLPQSVPEIKSKGNPIIDRRFVDIQNALKKHSKDITDLLITEGTLNEKPSKKQKKISLNIIKKMNKAIKSIEEYIED